MKLLEGHFQAGTMISAILQMTLYRRSRANPQYASLSNEHQVFKQSQ